MNAEMLNEDCFTPFDAFSEEDDGPDSESSAELDRSIEFNRQWCRDC